MTSRQIKQRATGSPQVAIVCVAMASLCVVAIGYPSSASGESLRQALAAAYRTNPELDAERARLRATDEQVSQARAGFRPSVTGSGAATYDNQRSKPPSTGDGRVYPKSLSIDVRQPIFRGFRTIGQLREAESNVRAGRAILRNVEQNVLLAAVTAYVNVVRDQAVVRLNENNLKVLSRELRATLDRFNVGEVTKTDVAQARSRRSLAVSQLEAARSTLKASRAEYQRVIGFAPGRLRQPKVPYSRLPKTRQSAIKIAYKENPIIVAALYREAAARHVITQIKGELLPELSLEASGSKGFDVPGITKETRNLSVVGRLSVPLYTGGLVSSRVRAAKHTHISRIQEIEQNRVLVRSNVISAWSQLNASRAQLVAARTRVTADRTALQGVREEERVGQRTLLDVLNAELELLNSEVALVTNIRDEIVSAYTLLTQIGRLSAKSMKLSSTIYDAKVHYNQVRRKWFGLSITHADGRKERLNVWRPKSRKQSKK